MDSTVVKPPRVRVTSGDLSACPRRLLGLACGHLRGVPRDRLASRQIRNAELMHTQVGEAAVSMECELGALGAIARSADLAEHEYPLIADDGKRTGTVLFGRVKLFHVRSDLFVPGQGTATDIAKLMPVSCVQSLFRLQLTVAPGASVVSRTDVPTGCTSSSGRAGRRSRPRNRAARSRNCELLYSAMFSSPIRRHWSALERPFPPRILRPFDRSAFVSSPSSDRSAASVGSSPASLSCLSAAVRPCALSLRRFAFRLYLQCRRARIIVRSRRSRPRDHASSARATASLAAERTEPSRLSTSSSPTPTGSLDKV